MKKCMYCNEPDSIQELCPLCLQRYDDALGYYNEAYATMTATKFLEYTKFQIHGFPRWGFIIDLSYEVCDL